MIARKAAVVAPAGPVLEPYERDLLRTYRPFGVILFRRNVVDREQLRALIKSIREATSPAEVLLFVDQEGGRVARLRAPVWQNLPPAAELGRIAARSPEHGMAAARTHASLIAHDLVEVGFDVVCAPVLDVAPPEQKGAIGDRALSPDPRDVTRLGRVVVEAFLDAGILPVIKHLPGQGRTEVDSHEALPFVDASEAELRAVDLVPFQTLADAPFGMTGHVVFRCWDGAHPATLSPFVIRHAIRDLCGFQGALLSDDLGMGALSGSIGSRVRTCLAAGCDLAVQCSGKPDELGEALDAAFSLDGEPLARVNRALAMRRSAWGIDPVVARAELERLVATV